MPEPPLFSSLTDNPNRAMDANVRAVSPNHGFWLGKHAKSGFGGVPSTFLPAAPASVG